MSPEVWTTVTWMSSMSSESTPEWTEYATNRDFLGSSAWSAPLAIVRVPAVRPVAMSEAEASCDSTPVSRAWPTGCRWCPPAASSRRGQRNFLLGLLTLCRRSGWCSTCSLTIIVIVAWSTLSYLIAVIYRAYLFTRSSKVDALEIVTDEEALSVPESELPVYTIMVPAYREASVITQTDRQPRSAGVSRGPPRGAPPGRGGRRGDHGRAAHR